ITRTFEGCGSIASGPGEHIVARGSAGDGGASERGATGDHALRPDCPHRITGGGRGDDGVPLCGLEGESGVERQPVSILPSAGGGDGGRRVGTVVRRFSLVCVWLARVTCVPQEWAGCGNRFGNRMLDLV